LDLINLAEAYKEPNRVNNVAKFLSMSDNPGSAVFSVVGTATGAYVGVLSMIGAAFVDGAFSTALFSSMTGIVPAAGRLDGLFHLSDGFSLRGRSGINNNGLGCGGCGAHDSCWLVYEASEGIVIRCPDVDARHKHNVLVHVQSNGIVFIIH